MSETKRRLLLSKWHAAQQAVQEDLDGLAWQIDQLESVLVEVKYWLHRGLVHHKIVSDPRKLLRQIEDVL